MANPLDGPSTVLTTVSTYSNAPPQTFVVTYVYPITPIETVINGVTTHSQSTNSKIPGTVFDGATPLPAASTETTAKAVSSTGASLTTSASLLTSSTSGNATATESPTTGLAEPTVIAPSPSTVLADTAAARNGLESGAVAGIAIGTLVFGLLLGAAAAFFILRKSGRARKSAESSEGSESPISTKSTALAHDDYEGKAVLVESSASKMPEQLQLAQYLPAPVPDKELASELQALGYLIQQHVENHYHLAPVEEKADLVEQNLGGLGIEECGAVPASRLASLLLDAKTRYAALQHAISTAIFGHLAASSPGSYSLLPTSVSEFAREFCSLGDKDDNQEVTELALSQWRRLTAFVLNPDRGDRGSLLPRQDAIREKAQRLASSLGKFLGFFVEADDRKAQEAHLEQVILECAKFGYVVFSQPTELRFNFTSTEELVTHPGLDAVLDEQGNKNEPPVQVLEPTIESLG